MNAKVTQVTLVVNNQEKALAFYTERVGFEKKTDFAPPGRGRWVTVGPKGHDLEIALFQAGSRTEPPEVGAHWKPGMNPPIVMRVDDCKKAFQELKARGVQFRDSEPKEQPWGVVATFTDPDGNPFSLVQPPAQWPQA
jgi:predicted enzyme related to lactoylglutathione lyase